MNRCWLLLAAILVLASGCNIPTLGIYAGTATETVAGMLRSDDPSGATGDTLDLVSDLGVSDKAAPLDMRLVFAKGRGMFDVSYSRRSIASTGVLAGITDFSGVPLDIGAVNMDLALDEYRACVGLRTISASKKYIASARAGVLGADWSVVLDDSAAQTATAAQLTIMPVVGAGLEMKMGPLASIFAECEGMDMDMFDTQARLFGWSAGIKVSFIQAQLMLGYRSRSLDIEEDGDRFSLDTDGGTIAFQLRLSLSM